MDRVDVAIIGAGVVGLFTAITLGRAGYSVVVLERESRPMMGVSSRTANVIHVLQPPFNSLKSRLCLEGNRLHFKESSILGYRVMETSLLLARSGPASGIIASIAARLLRRVLPQGFSVRVLGSREALEAEPGLSDTVKSVVEVGGYGVVDYRGLARALEAAARSYGSLYTGEPVQRASPQGDSMLLETSGMTVKARFVVNAAGLDSHRVAEVLGAPGYVQTPIKGVMSLHGGPRLRHIVAPLELRRGETKGGGAIPQVDGSLLLGPTNSGPASPGDYSYSRRDLDMLRSRFQPLLAEELKPASRVIVGLRPVHPGRDFRIKWGPRGRVVHLVGIESPGLTAAPAIARLVLRMIESRTRP